jgi:hypothetical protein
MLVKKGEMTTYLQRGGLDLTDNFGLVNTPAWWRVGQREIRFYLPYYNDSPMDFSRALFTFLFSVLGISLLNSYHLPFLPNVGS